MTKVLISGASIAGPALAYWLDRYGFAVTVVERAPTMRPGGQAVDFKGATHRRVLTEMGIIDEVHRRQTGRTDLMIVDERGRRQASLPGEFTGGDVEILRGDLAEILHQRTAERCEYVFGDSITALKDTGEQAEVTFAHGAPRAFDLVIGADGIHSAVRRLGFGPEERYVEHLGYYYAVAGGSPDGAEGRRTGTMYNEPGRLATEGGPKAPRMFVFASDPICYDRTDVAQQQRILTDAFAGAGWEVPRLLAELCDDLYLDAIARVRMDSYVDGRVALLGDAAYGNTLGGFGTGLAVVGAYVLAGELAAAGGDHRVAFRRYDELMHGYAKVARKGSAGAFLAPRTAARIRMRNWMLRFSLPMRLMMKLTDRLATDIDLPDYPRRLDR